MQRDKKVFYWQKGVEIDFVNEKRAIQVIATTKIPDREIKAFKEFKKKYKKITKHIIISEEKQGREKEITYIQTKNFLEE